jgi:twitching motility protein PilT
MKRGAALAASAETDSGIVSDRISMAYLARALVKYSASDLHIKAGRPPLYRINGKLVPAKMGELRPDEVQTIIHGVLTDGQRRDLAARRQIDFSFRIPELGRFRCNAYYQRSTLSAAVRMIPLIVPQFNDLGLPPVLRELAERQRGLLLVTGATGSGKSTTMASLIQHLNETRALHILTVEDPIEFVHRDQKGTVTQREIGSDTPSFEEALRAGMRQDPDVIVIGEMRDRATIQAALTAAETGHLVISTLHTSDAKGTLDRILDVFPSDAQNQVRIQLAHALVGVVSQKLIVRADGKGRIPAVEVMVKSPAIEDCLLKNERERIPQAIATSNAYYKMQTMNMALERLLHAGLVTRADAMHNSPNPGDLELRLQGIDREEGYALAGVSGMPAAAPIPPDGPTAVPVSEPGSKADVIERFDTGFIPRPRPRPLPKKPGSDET